jgi:hypothetical protein
MRKTFRLVPIMVLALSAVASTACATGYAYGQRGTYRDRGPYGDGGYTDRGAYREIERRAYDNGYRDGLRRGENDGRSRHRFDPTRHGDWRNADDGFRREYGDHNLYRRNFRAGFEAGYAQAYRQSDRGYRRW